MFTQSKTISMMMKVEMALNGQERQEGGHVKEEEEEH